MAAVLVCAARFVHRGPVLAPLSRGFCAEAVKPGFPRRLVNFLTRKVAVPMPFALAALYGTNSWLQDSIGSDKDFFSGTFTTTKDPDAISEFYQAEDLLKIIAIHPFIFNIVMDKVVPTTEEVTEQTALLSLGETNFKVSFVGLDVSFEIIEQEVEDENGDIALTHFARHERFVDYFPLLADFGLKLLMWDQTWNYGFKKLDDGTYEVFHHGESFTGPWPVRLIVMLHQRYVLWACERFINSEAFGTDDIDEQQEQLACIPLHEFRTFMSKLRVEKERDLEARERDPTCGKVSIAEAKAAVENLKGLEKASSSTITVATRLARRDTSAKDGTFAARDRARLVVGDSKTQEALAMALKDAKFNTEINDAVQRLKGSASIKTEPTPARAARKRDPSSVIASPTG